MIKNRRFFELVAGIDRATVVVVAVVVSISFQQPTDCAAAFSPLYLLSISFLPFPLSLSLSPLYLLPRSSLVYFENRFRGPQSVLGIGCGGEGRKKISSTEKKILFRF